MVTVKIHKDALKDVQKDLSTDERVELGEVLCELQDMSMEELLEKSEPVDLEQMEKEEPELYERLTKRVNQIKSGEKK